MKNNNQSGFSLIEGLIVILIVAIVGATGTFVYYKNNYQPAGYANQQSRNKPTAQPIKKISQQSVKNLKYLSITQWGVSAAYTSQDTLSYEISPKDSNLAFITSKYMSDNYGCTLSSAINGSASGAGGIGRYIATASADIMTPAPETWSQLAIQDPTDYKQIGQYVYGFSHDQASCGNSTSSTTDPYGNPENLTNSLIVILQAS